MPAVRPVLVVGVSGAGWDLLDPLLRAGRLPQLARLRQEGAWATLASVRVEGDRHYRPQAAWASVATGCVPERHGITRYFHEAAELREPPLWQRYAELGLPVGLYGWPATWPPPAVPGFVVPSHLARDERTWPPELAPIKRLDRGRQEAERDGGGGRRAALGELLALRRLGLGPRAAARLAPSLGAAVAARGERRALLLRRAKLDLGAELFLQLTTRFRPRLAAFVTFYLDFAEHRYLRYARPELYPPGGNASAHGLGGAVDDAAAAVDAVLGRLVAALPRETVTFVVSEHGMAPEPRSGELGDVRLLIRGRRVAELAGLDPAVEARPVARWVAFRAPPGAVLTADVAARLRTLVVAETGLPLFGVHQHGPDEVVVKLDLRPEVPRYAAGDLLALHVEHPGGRVAVTELLRPAGSPRSAMHARDGVLVAHGPGVTRGLALSEASVLDVAPTVLAAAGLDVPESLDGRVLPLLDGGHGTR